MNNEMNLSDEERAIRAHDITVCLESGSVSDFETLTLLGMSVRLALHLRGVQAVRYETVRDVAVYLLDIPSVAVRQVVEHLAKAEFVRLDQQGKTIRSVIPNVPYYDEVFRPLGELAADAGFSEPEELALELMHRLSTAPLLKDNVYRLGAEKKLTDHIINIGVEAGFVVDQRARGRSVLLSPTYFSENVEAYADLTVASGNKRVGRLLELLKRNQGWPLAMIERQREIGGEKLDDNDVLTLQALAGGGFVAPPAISTTHSGTNHFLFGPRPGAAYLPPTKRPIHESAMALVAAIRQGQLLPAMYAIRSPELLLRSFRDKGYLNATTEAVEQYRKVAELRVARLEIGQNGYARLVLIDRPENKEAVDMAIMMVSGSAQTIAPSDNITVALRKGDEYVESLVGRKRIAVARTLKPDSETGAEIDAFLLRGRQ